MCTRRNIKLKIENHLRSTRPAVLVVIIRTDQMATYNRETDVHSEQNALTPLTLQRNVLSQKNPLHKTAKT